MSSYRTSGGLDDPDLLMGDGAFLKLSMRRDPSQLLPGEISLSENGRMENGEWQPRKGISNLSGSLQIDGDPLRLPFWLVDEPGGEPVFFASLSSGYVYVSIDTGFTFQGDLGDMAYLKVSGLTGVTDPNGVHLMELRANPPGGPQVLRFPFAGSDEDYTGSGFVANYLDDSAAAQIFGSELYSDPNSENAEYIIQAATGTAFKVEVATGTVTAIPYPTGLLLEGPVDLRAAFDRVFLFRDGQRTWEWIPPATDFTEVPAGVYTQPQVFEATGTNVTVVSGLCTVTIAGNTTIETGDTNLQIYGSDDPHFVDFVGKQYVVVFADATTVKFYIPVADLSTIGTNILSIGKQVSIGAGFQRMPAPPWGVYHQRRLIVPYRYTPAGSNMSPTYASRGITDELVISDVLDPHTYDAIENQFRITAGTADFLVAVQPFADDFLIVFMRNSIHLISGVSGALDDCTTNELTREIGCLSRKSIAQHGPDVFFLSDNGVYAIGFLDVRQLRGTEVPLSEPIQPLIDRINPDLAVDSVAEYFANRYYIAVPLDSAPGANDATGNNAVLVYNFLNDGWESLDFVNDSRWNVIGLHISRAGQRNDLYAVNSLGGVHKLDSEDSDFDQLALSPGDSLESIRVDSDFKTRRYIGDTLERKRYTAIQAQVSSSGLTSEATFDFEAEDPDSTTTVGTISSLQNPTTALGPNEGASLRGRIGGVRGQGGIVRIRPSIGRPRVRSVKVMGTITNRSTTSVK